VIKDRYNFGKKEMTKSWRIRLCRERREKALGGIEWNGGGGVGVWGGERVQREKYGLVFEKDFNGCRGEEERTVDFGARHEAPQRQAEA